MYSYDALHSNDERTCITKEWRTNFHINIWEKQFGRSDSKQPSKENKPMHNTHLTILYQEIIIKSVFVLM